MRAFVDTNVLAATIEGSEGSEAGRRLLNDDDVEVYISLLNLVELRNIFLKHKHIEKHKVEIMLGIIHESVDTLIESFPDLSDCYNSHKDTLMDPMDCLLWETSRIHNADFITLERELHSHGAKSPSEIYE